MLDAGKVLTLILLSFDMKQIVKRTTELKPTFIQMFMLHITCKLTLMISVKCAL